MTSRSPHAALRPPSPRHGWVWWLPLVAVMIDMVAELLVHGREPVSFMLIAVPPLAAATRGPRGTALSAVVCLGLEMWMAARRPGHFDEQHHIAMYVATFLIGIASVALSWQREQTRQHLIRAGSVAETMQRTLLRPVPPRLGHLRAAAFYEAGEGGTLVGGALYDVCETPFAVRAVIGDVRGKGLNAVQTVAAVRGSFRDGAGPGVPARAQGARRLTTAPAPALPLSIVSFLRTDSRHWSTQSTTTTAPPSPSPATPRPLSVSLTDAPLKPLTMSVLLRNSTAKGALAMRRRTRWSGRVRGMRTRRRWR
ncbi:hypothetical protein [Streptomyces sp. NPDC059861]|uniref:hypothetical protein n=1 Tax=Streptomyces sp. NPDC059861 TaxID=3346974 RepID=UPI003665AB58